MAGSGRKVWAADEVLAAADLQNYIQDQVVFVYNSASARTSGILSPTEGMISYLKDTNALEMFDGSSWVNVLPNTGTAGTYTKVTTDAKGRVTSGTTLSGSDLPASGVSAGTYTKVAVDTTGRVTSGTTLSAGDIPNISTSQVTGYGTGTWNGALNIPSGDSFFASRILGPSLNYILDTAGNISCAAVMKADGGVRSENTYNRSVAYGAYRAVWVNVDGYFGHTASSRTVKQDIVPTSFDSDSVLDVEIVDFKYIDAVERFGDDAALEIGVIAEQLIDCGMERFVFFDDDGSPAGVHYERLAVALIPQVQKQAKLINDLAARVEKLESK